MPHRLFRDRRDAGQVLAHPRQRVPQPEHHQRPHPVRQANPALRHPEPRGDQRVRVVGLVPRDEIQAQAARGRRLRSGQLEPRHDHERPGPGGGRAGRVRRRRNHQAGEPLKLVRVVAGQVAQVRAGGEQQSGQARIPGRRRGQVKPARRVEARIKPVGVHHALRSSVTPFPHFPCLSIISPVRMLPASRQRGTRCLTLGARKLTRCDLR